MPRVNVDGAARNSLIELLRIQLPRITFGELEEILASPIGRTLRNTSVWVLFHGTKRRVVPPPTRIQFAFARLEQELLVARPPNRKMRGRRSIPMMLAIFARLVEMRSDDLIGTPSEIVAQIDARIPGLALSPLTTAPVLNALALSPRGLVTRPTERTWRVRLAELCRPTSKFCKRFCASYPPTRRDEGEASSRSVESPPEGPGARLQRAFARLERELSAVRLPDRRMRGRRSIPVLLAVFARLVEMRSHDLTGTSAEIVGQIEAQIPGLGLSPETTSLVLHALALSPRGLVTRPTWKTWRVRLAELSRPTSSFYRQLCALTPPPRRSDEGEATSRPVARPPEGPGARLQQAFARLERELSGVYLPDRQVRGRRSIPNMLAVFARLVEMKSGDLTGTPADIVEQIAARIPGLGLSSKTTTLVLKALALSPRGLVTRPTRRTWRVRLAELSRPTSIFYGQFCTLSPWPQRRSVAGMRRDEGEATTRTAESP